MKRDDVELIHNILSGDGTAFKTLVEKYQKRIHAIAWQRTGDYHIAEEITQDVFLQAYNKLSTLKDPNKFSRWLHVITKRRCTNWLQREKPMTQSLEATDRFSLEKSDYARYVAELREEKAAEHRTEIVKKLLDKLPESERTVITLYYLGEMTTGVISKYLDVSVNTVKSQLRRARKRLKEEYPMILDTFNTVKPTFDITDYAFIETMESELTVDFESSTPELTNVYTGQHTVEAIMSTYDTIFNKILKKITVGIKGGITCQLTIQEIDNRYPRAEWLQLLLDRGLTIENYAKYATYLSKRHTLAFLEDNPDLRKAGFLNNLPLTDDWQAYKIAYIEKLIDIERQVDHAKEQLAQVEKS